VTSSPATCPAVPPRPWQEPLPAAALEPGQLDFTIPAGHALLAELHQLGGVGQVAVMDSRGQREPKPVARVGRQQRSAIRLDGLRLVGRRQLGPLPRLGCGQWNDRLGGGLAVDRVDVVEPPRLLLLLLGDLGRLADGDLGDDRGRG
jgi:hypothetical protein